MDAQNLLYLILLVVSLLVSAFFAGSETALVALGRIDLARLRESGDPRAAILRGLKAHTSRLLASYAHFYWGEKPGWLKTLLA